MLRHQCYGKGAPIAGILNWSDTQLALQLQEQLSAEEAFRLICTSAAQAMDLALTVFLETDDPSGPHKARVALRRLTTALDAFLPLLRRKQAAALRAQAKEIFRLLGEVRDSDVHLQAQRKKAASQKWIKHNHRLRKTARETLRRNRAVGFPHMVRQAVHEGGTIYRRSKAALDRRCAPVSQLAASVLAEAWERCLTYGASVWAIPQDRRHDFRKDMKTLRYLAEFFADQFPGLQEEPFRSDFRDIQDDLGTVNDHEVALGPEGKRRPGLQPRPVAEALERADQLWARLSASSPPWADQAAQRP